MKVQVTACDVCRKPIADGARRLTMTITLGIINGHERSESKTLTDLCGEECLHTAVNDLTKTVEQIR